MAMFFPHKIYQILLSFNIGPDNRIFGAKNFSYPSLLGAQKNHLIETALLSITYVLVEK